MERFKWILVQHLRKMEQTDDSKKETMYLVRIDDNESLWLLELDLIYTACLMDNIESTEDLIYWYSVYDIDVEIPKSMEDDLTRLIRHIQGNDKQ